MKKRQRTPPHAEMGYQEVAKFLGINPATVARQVEKLGIEPHIVGNAKLLTREQVGLLRVRKVGRPRKEVEGSQ